MSSSGGGIVVKADKVNGAFTHITKSDGQAIVDALRNCGNNTLADQIQPVITNAD